MVQFLLMGKQAQVKLIPYKVNKMEIRVNVDSFLVALSIYSIRS